MSAAETIELAFQLIAGEFPNLVITDITFSSNQQDGFTLFEKMKEHPVLKKIPIFFMSRLRDEKIIRAAMRLGLDLYFPKPIDQELLIATIEGRLRIR